RLGRPFSEPVYRPPADTCAICRRPSRLRRMAPRAAHRPSRTPRRRPGALVTLFQLLTSRTLCAVPAVVSIALRRSADRGYRRRAALRAYRARSARAHPDRALEAGRADVLDPELAAEAYRRAWSDSELREHGLFGEGLALVRRWVAREGVVDPASVLGI